MKTMHTDQGTLQLISALGRPAVIRLHEFLNRCRDLRPADEAIGIAFQNVDFAGRRDVRDMKLEYRHDADGKVLGTTNFTSGALWRRGQLRIAGVVLPQSVTGAVKGMLIEQLVEGSPLTGFRINGVVQDGGDVGKLRIRCTAEKTGPIEIDFSAPEMDIDMLERLAAEHADADVDPVAAHVLARMDRADALLAVIRATQAKAGTKIRLPIVYEELITAKPRPEHLKSTTWSGNEEIGKIDLKHVKAGFRIESSAAVMSSSMGCIIENGMVHITHRASETLDVEANIGFAPKGMTLSTKTSWVYGGMTSRTMQGGSSLGDVLGLQRPA